VVFLKMPRNTTGGKNFKKFKTGAEGYRAKASRECADDMIDLLTKQQKSPEKLNDSDTEALRFMFAGRVVRRFGHGRMEVYCHDGKTRQCRIRGLLRKKGQVFIDVDNIVVVSLRTAESSESSDEDLAGIGNITATTGTADIIGCFDERQVAILRKLSVNPRMFSNNDGQQTEDMFDRSDIINGGSNIIVEESVDIENI
jgi:initiation factor 1A